MTKSVVRVVVCLAAMTGSTLSLANVGMYVEPQTGVWRCQTLSKNELREQVQALVQDQATACAHNPVNDYLFTWLHTSNHLRIPPATEQLLVIYSYDQGLVADFVSLGRELMPVDATKPEAQQIQAVFDPQLLDAFPDYVRQGLDWKP